MYCPRCGRQADSADRYCGGCGTTLSAAADPRAGAASPQAPGRGKEELLSAIERALAGCPAIKVTRGQKSDMLLESVLADTKWAMGKKKVEYHGALLARAHDRTIVYWESLKEVGAGLQFPFGFKVETYRSDGKTASGQVKEVGWSPGGKGLNYGWDYARTRELIEQVARSHGWDFTTALLKRNAEF